MNSASAAPSSRQRSALALSAAGLPIFRCCCAVSWPWVLLGGAAAAASLLLLSALTRKLGRRRLPILAPLFVLGAVGAAIASSYAFPETAGNPLAVAPVLVLSLAAAAGGAEAAGRCAGILLRVTGALYGIVLLFSLPQLRLSRLVPAGAPSDALCVWAALLLPGAALCLPAEAEDGQLPRWPLWSAGTALAASLVTGGILSPALAREAEPFRTLARGVSVLGVIRRFEALVNGAMLMSGFCLCTLLLTAADALCGKCFSERNGVRGLSEILRKKFENSQKKC